MLLSTMYEGNMRISHVEINTYLKELKSGNNDSLANIYLLTKNQVYAVCLAVLKDYALAEDAMQNTYIRVREKINYYKDDTNGYAWIVTLARNISINLLNKNSRENVTDFSEQEFLTPSFDEIKMKDMPIFNIAKKVLNSEELEIVLLYVVGGYKHREIAKMIEKPLGTVLWSYNNSLKKLKKAIQDKEV